MKKVLYIDMDNVLVDFPSGIEKLDKKTKLDFRDKYDEAPGIFSLMEPMKDAVASFNLLANKYDTYILSTAPWKNPSAWSDKLLWVQKHLLTTILPIQIDGRLLTALTVILVYLTILPILYLAPLVEKAIGKVGVMVIARILYIFICAKGVSFVLSGLHVEL